MDHLRTRRIIALASCVALAASHFATGLTGRSRGLGLIDGNANLVVPVHAPAAGLARLTSRHQ
jgi:hypothetical protein